MHKTQSIDDRIDVQDFVVVRLIAAAAHIVVVLKREPLTTSSSPNVAVSADVKLTHGDADPARLYIFDMLAKGKRDLRALPLSKRKMILRESFDNTDGLVYVTGIESTGLLVFAHAEAHDVEGIIAKRITSPYQRGRTRGWIKIKSLTYSRQAARGFGPGSKA